MNQLVNQVELIQSVHNTHIYNFKSVDIIMSINLFTASYIHVSRVISGDLWSTGYDRFVSVN